MNTAYNLRIHFAPSTACIDLLLDKEHYEELFSAMEKHKGSIRLQLSTTGEIVIETVQRP